MGMVHTMVHTMVQMIIRPTMTLPNLSLIPQPNHPTSPAPKVWFTLHEPKNAAKQPIRFALENTTHQAHPAGAPVPKHLLTFPSKRKSTKRFRCHSLQIRKERVR